MDEPLNIEISKFQKSISATKSIATYQQGDHVVVQLWQGETRLYSDTLTYEEYLTFKDSAPEYGLPNYPPPEIYNDRETGGTTASGNTIGRVVGETAKAEVPATSANPPQEAETEKESWWKKTSPWVHGTLDGVGFVPGLGAIPDGISAFIYVLEGDIENAGLAAFAAIPVIGDAAKGGVLVGKAAGKVNRSLKNSHAKTPKSSPPTERKPNGPKNNGGKSKGEKRDCRLRKYGNGKNCPPGKTGHHIVADRAFRLPNKNKNPGPRVPGGLSHANGYTICVDGGTPTKKGSKANEHGLIHAIYDPAERELGSRGTPEGTATLGELELIGVMAASAITGCNPTKMLAELHAYHTSMGLKPGDRYRAYNKTNLLNHDDITKLGSKTQKGSGGL
ncbi:hypothetical protein D3C76_532520 [compost metagenome]|uniref:hypothetical protein n=1 Tax=unclassified Pseudomonas TaxID=196821 RepID=UPI000F949A0E|nr:MULTISPECIES: hypothetical protein [unclassified Pseudomonas]MBT9235785.1 hypothetical protein [Pseudomonas sp. MG-2]